MTNMLKLILVKIFDPNVLKFNLYLEVLQNEKFT